MQKGASPTTQFLNHNNNRGLQNLGNTSFMNSGFQCVSHINQLSEYFLQGKYFSEINKVNPLGTKGQLSTFFAEMIKGLWLGTQPSFSPINLVNAIKKFNPIFSGYNHQDSSEFISYLLDGLHEDLNRVKVKPYVQMKAYECCSDMIIAKQAWEAFTKRNSSIIADLMYGQSKSVVECLRCKHSSTHFDPFIILSLPLINNSKKNKDSTSVQTLVHDSTNSSKNQGIKLEDCFDYFKEPQIMQLDNSWFCPKCKEFVQAKKQNDIYKAPKVLIVSLKRFTIKQYHNIFVDYPVTGLDLTNFVIDPELPQGGQQVAVGTKIIYDLIGVSNHIGNAEGGHYTACCKDISEDKWYLFDDSHVSQIKDSKQVVSHLAYVLFYRRRQ